MAFLKNKLILVGFSVLVVLTAGTFFVWQSRQTGQPQQNEQPQSASIPSGYFYEEPTYLPSFLKRKSVLYFRTDKSVYESSRVDEKEVAELIPLGIIGLQWTYAAESGGFLLIEQKPVQAFDQSDSLFLSGARRGSVSSKEVRGILIHINVLPDLVELAWKTDILVVQIQDSTRGALSLEELMKIVESMLVPSQDERTNTVSEEQPTGDPDVDVMQRFRDTTRVSELATVETGIDVYYDIHGEYPQVSTQDEIANFKTLVQILIESDILSDSYEPRKDPVTHEELPLKYIGDASLTGPGCNPENIRYILGVTLVDPDVRDVNGFPYDQDNNCDQYSIGADPVISCNQPGEYCIFK